MSKKQLDFKDIATDIPIENTFQKTADELLKKANERRNMIDKYTRFFIIGIFTLLIIIFIFMLWYTSNIKIESSRAKPNYQAYDIEEGVNILLNGVNELKEVQAQYEKELSYWKSRIDLVYHRYYPKGSAQDVDSQFRAIEQRLSIFNFGKEK